MIKSAQAWHRDAATTGRQPNLDIERIKEFLDLADTLSFSRSAYNLNMTQSTLSRHIADLEEKTGKLLFDRTTASVRLTAAGKAFYEKALDTVEAFGELMATTKATPDKAKTTVLIAGSTLQPTENRIITALSGRAASRCLPIRFGYCKPRSLSNDPPAPFSEELLSSGKTDLVIDTYSLGQQPELAGRTKVEAVHICRERLRLIGSPDNPHLGDSHLALEDLRDMRLVALAVHKHCSGVMTAPFHAAEVDPRPRTVFINDIQEIPERLACLARDEIVFLQEGFCEAYGFGAPLSQAGVALPLDDERAHLDFWGLIRADESRPAVLQAFNLLKELAEELHASQLLNPPLA